MRMRIGHGMDRLVAMIASSILLLMLYAPRPSSAVVDLPLSDINVLAITDDHSWLAGHGREDPQRYDADYGHILSFYQRLRAHCEDTGVDLWLVANGDYVDGTGLALNANLTALAPLLERMPFAAVNIGNHDLYRKKGIEYMQKNEFFGSALLTSNVVDATTSVPLGSNYTILTGTSTLLAFGFLYNQTDADDKVTVKGVQAVVEEEWFAAALQNETFDAILVLAHMGSGDPLIRVILDKIRSLVGPDMPVQFITGHTHNRVFDVLDAASTSAESGKFLETVGFVSFPTSAALPATPNASLFQHRFLDANVDLLTKTLGVKTLQTIEGEQLSSFINQTEQELGLFDVVGCLESTLYLNTSLHDADSLWKFYLDQVVPAQFADTEVLFFEKESLRYDLVVVDGRPIIEDDIVKASPFNLQLFGFEGVPGYVILRLNETMNEHIDPFLPFLPDYVLSSSDIIKNESYTLITSPLVYEVIPEMVKNITGGAVSLSLNNETERPSSTGVWIKHIREYFPCGDKVGSGEDPSADTTGTDADTDTTSSAPGGASFSPLIVLPLVSALLLWSRRHC